MLAELYGGIAIAADWLDELNTKRQRGLPALMPEENVAIRLSGEPKVTLLV